VNPYLLHHSLERAAASGPDRLAVVDGKRSITYRDLDERANRMANFLLDRGLVRGARVGLYLPKSLDAIVCIYGILKAGGTYVPFDPHAPVARLGYMARDCDMRILLAHSSTGATVGDLVRHGAPLETVLIVDGAQEPILEVDGAQVQTGSVLENASAEVPETHVTDRDLAYILYTSGSTGEPKGVMLSHRNALGFVVWAADCVSVRSDDRLSSHAPLHFDLSVFDLFAASYAGASVSLVPAQTAMFPVEVGRFIDEQRITVWYSVPSILTMLAVRGGLTEEAFPGLRTIVFAGEVFPTKYLRMLMGLLPHVEFYNWYGPTETNVCTWYRVPPLAEGRDEDIPIGRGIANTDVFAVTDDGRVAATGEVGELYVRGPTVMQGYWGDRDRTERVLVANPFGVGAWDRVYRTGDLARMEDSGDYRFLGRRDAQIKSRGYRIELGEIETALNAHPRVLESAVLAVPDEMITNRILAFVVVQGDAVKRELIRWCAERLPRYMIPEAIEFSETLPRTSTGKIDRRALSENVRR
jgi:amino acid adenylation domain-containing protein